MWGSKHPAYDGDEQETLTAVHVYSWQAVAWITALDYLMWLF